MSKLAAFFQSAIDAGEELQNPAVLDAMFSTIAEVRPEVLDVLMGKLASARAAATKKPEPPNPEQALGMGRNHHGFALKPRPHLPGPPLIYLTAPRGATVATLRENAIVAARVATVLTERGYAVHCPLLMERTIVSLRSRENVYHDPLADFYPLTHASALAAISLDGVFDCIMVRGEVSTAWAYAVPLNLLNLGTDFDATLTDEYAVEPDAPAHLWGVGGEV